LSQSARGRNDGSGCPEVQPCGPAWNPAKELSCSTRGNPTAAFRGDRQSSILAELVQRYAREHRSWNARNAAGLAGLLPLAGTRAGEALSIKRGALQVALVLALGNGRAGE